MGSCQLPNALAPDSLIQLYSEYVEKGGETGLYDYIYVFELPNILVLSKQKLFYAISLCPPNPQNACADMKVEKSDAFAS